MCITRQQGCLASQGDVDKQGVVSSGHTQVLLEEARARNQELQGQLDESKRSGLEQQALAQALNEQLTLAQTGRAAAETELTKTKSDLQVRM